MSRFLDKQMVRETASGRMDRVEDLLSRGAEVNRLHRDGFTPLMRSAYYGHAGLVRLLLHRGADPNATARDGASALFWACVRGHEQAVDMLLVAGAEVNAVRRSDRGDGDGPSPLNVAISGGYLRIAERLVATGASLDHRYLGRNIRQYAKWHHAEEFITFLKRRGRPAKRCR
jgi:ankyrin repeat protein